CPIVQARPRTRPSPTSPSPPTAARSRPVRCRAPIASPSTTSCSASRSSSAPRRATQAGRSCAAKSFAGGASLKWRVFSCSYGPRASYAPHDQGRAGSTRSNDATRHCSGEPLAKALPAVSHLVVVGEVVEGFERRPSLGLDMGAADVLPREGLDDLARVPKGDGDEL